MDETKLYFCLEARDVEEKHVCLIYSAKLGDLCKELYSKPQFAREAVILDFHQSMGCGVFTSKIVFAGGFDVQGEKKKHNRNLITYDMASNVISREEEASNVISREEKIPAMRGRKCRPLVFQLNNKLYVLDTSNVIRRNNFEIYFPNHKRWCRLYSPYLHIKSVNCINEAVSGRTPYCWFVFGMCVCICLPDYSRTFLHHACQMVKQFIHRFKGLLPFRGMATTYYQQGFDDVVVISFSEGRVEGRRLNLKPDYFGDPLLIFETETYEPDGEVSSYFADCGEGRFCLTTFDNVNIRIYMFKICRDTDREDGTLNLHLISQKMHKYHFRNFSPKGYKSFGILGCFASPRADLDKQVEEAKIYGRYFPFYDSADWVEAFPRGEETENRPLQNTDNSDSDDWEL